MNEHEKSRPSGQDETASPYNTTTSEGTPELPNRQARGFREWLTSKSHPERIRHTEGRSEGQSDGINDFAYDVVRDKAFPESGTLFDYVGYLQDLGARHEVIEALHCAWWLYRRQGFGGK